MEDDLVFGTVDYRNGLYQGIVMTDLPEGIGLFLDDHALMYCSVWRKGVCNEKTAVFLDRSKYFYGEWSAGKPHGFNVFRSGSVVLLGNYNNGTLIGKYILILESHSFVIIVDNKDSKQENLQKRYFSTDEQLKSITHSQFPKTKDKQDFLQIILFLKNNFCNSDGLLKLEYGSEGLRFGYLRGGLGVLFDDDNEIRRMGNMNEKGSVVGLGIIFGDQTNEEGNFEENSFVKYMIGSRPDERLKNIYRDEHRKSIYFQNHYLNVDIHNTINELQTIRKNLPGKIQTQLGKGSGTSIKNDFEDSLQIQRRKTISNTQKHPKQVKQQVEDQINRLRARTKHNQPKNIHTQMNHLYNNSVYRYRIVDPQSIRFDIPHDKSPEANRLGWMKNNSLNEYREFRHQPYEIRQHDLKSRYDRDHVELLRDQSVKKFKHNTLYRPYKHDNQYSPVAERVPSLNKSYPVVRNDHSAEKIYPSFIQPRPVSISKSSHQRQMQLYKQKQRQLERSRRKIENQHIEKKLDEIESIRKSQQLEKRSYHNSSGNKSKNDSLGNKSPSQERSLIQSITKPLNMSLKRSQQSIQQQASINKSHGTKSITRLQSIQKPRTLQKQQSSKGVRVQYQNQLERQQLEQSVLKNKSSHKKSRYELQPNTYIDLSKRQIYATPPKYSLARQATSKASESIIKKSQVIHNESINNEDLEEKYNHTTAGKYHSYQYENSERKQSKQKYHKIKEKIIEIQKESTSPQGLKSTSFERIVKKYHYYE